MHAPCTRTHSQMGNVPTSALGSYVPDSVMDLTPAPPAVKLDAFDNYEGNPYTQPRRAPVRAEPPPNYKLVDLTKDSRALLARTVAPSAVEQVGNRY